MVSIVLQSRIDGLSDETRARARVVAERLIEEEGISQEDAMTRALFDLDMEAAAPFRFRRTGLRWDE